MQVRVNIDVADVKRRQEAWRDAFADIQMFASLDAQIAGRAAYESLSAAFNAAAENDLDTAEKHMASYETEFTEFAGAVNEEVAGINTILYAHVTWVWRATFDRLRRNRLPFEPTASLTPLKPFDPGEKDEGRMVILEDSAAGRVT